MRCLWQTGLLLSVLMIVAGPRGIHGADAPDRTAGRQAYEKLIGKFPEDRQGFGVDTHLGAVDHQPMTYGLVLSAEAIRMKHAPNKDSRRRVTNATAWLLENQDLDGDGKPGWGLPQTWDAWADGTTNPANQPYTITTAICLDGLLDALAVPELWTDAHRDEIRGVMRAIVLRWCREMWSEGYGGGYFWYSPDPNDEVFGINASVMFLGSMSRLLAEQPGLFSDDERRLVEDRSDSLARAVVHTLRPREGLPFWKYAPGPNRYNNIQDNDLVHHVYILWGIETYRDLGGRVKLPWTREQAIASVGCFWRDGRMWALPQDAPAEPGGSISKSPPTLWSVGMALGFYARWADPERARRAFEAIDRDYGPWPELRLVPKGPKGEGNATFYPRHAAHALLGLAIYAYR